MPEIWDQTIFSIYVIPLYQDQGTETLDTEIVSRCFFFDQALTAVVFMFHASLHVLAFGDGDCFVLCNMEQTR